MHIDKFLGDAVMAWFNAPIPQHDHAIQAVLTALDIREAVRLLQLELTREFHLSFGAGIHYGEAILGLIGTEKRIEYTAIGDSVNTTKRIQEKLIRGSGIDWASFRPTLVYGIGDWRHTAPLLRRCAAPKGTLWIPHSGRSKINPVHVEDVVDAVLRFFHFERGVDCAYELAGPEGIAYNEFIDLTIQATGGRVRRRNLDKKWVDRLIFLKGLFTDVTDDRRASAYFTLHHEHDITNAIHELDWHPRPYAEGIREVARGDWWRAQD